MQGHREIIIRKMAHFTEYFILAVLTYRIAIRKWNLSRAAWVTLGFCVFYACTDEFHQTFVPGRVGSPIDVIIDSTGAFFGLKFIQLLYRKGIIGNFGEKSHADV